MRISDWSSDVCSSDLLSAGPTGTRDHQPYPRPAASKAAIRLWAKNGSVYLHRVSDISEHIQNSTLTAATKSGGLRLSLGGRRTLFKHFVDEAERLRDRKRGVTGKRVSVRVSLGGRRINKKKNTKTQKQTTTK